MSQCYQNIIDKGTPHLLISDNIQKQANNFYSFLRLCKDFYKICRLATISNGCRIQTTFLYCLMLKYVCSYSTLTYIHTTICFRCHFKITCLTAEFLQLFLHVTYAKQQVSTTLAYCMNGSFRRRR